MQEALTIKPLQKPIEARVVPPGSKSYTNRVLPLAALAQGESVIEGALFSDDTKYMAQALRQLGVGVLEMEAQNRFVVHGTGGHWQPSSEPLFIGNSGTSARFLAPLVALGHSEYVIDGVPAMQKRPIAPLIEALNRLGAEVESMQGTGCPPIRIRGRGVRGGSTRIRGDISSQYLSGLLMSAPYFEQGLRLEVEGDLVSKPYLEVTAQAMGAFGVQLELHDFERFSVAPSCYKPTVYSVEPDASAASYLFAAAAILGGRMTVPGLGKNSLQGDLGFVRVLEQMGCSIEILDHETTVTGTGQLRGIEVNMSQISDTAQTLAAVAVFADAPTRVTGIGFIRAKETDRIGAVVRELQRLGIQAIEEADGFIIHPGQITPANVETYDDHRMAMSFALIGLKQQGVTILDPKCTAKTFPTYWDVLEGLR
ncbi:MAG: 3-phosphoshikimate 1-carboxyvinyltransferase [Deinococcales bacterium]